MPAKWTGEIVGMLHVNDISQKELAEHLGLTRQYISLVLSSVREPAGMETRMKDAINEIVQAREQNQSCAE